MSTPVTSPPLDEVTTALLALFGGTGRTVYDGAYDGDPVNPTYPYGVLYAVPGGNADPLPDLGGALTTTRAAWQVTAVSAHRNQAQRAAREFRDRLLTRAPTGWVYPLPVPAGWAVIERAPDPVPAGVNRDGNVPTAVYTAPFRFYLTLTPA